ncbi:hypothetical protein L7F22_063070 [Adiantum nelumboides]|nr:hypothetical protein [Adiantum nelumboides]
MKIDANDRDVFDLTGPKHLCNRRLTSIHKSAVIAALVQAVYVAEVDRQQKTLDMYAFAPKWWNELGYEPVSFLSEEDQSEPIVGMVFKKVDGVENGFRSYAEDDACALPAMVVAMRGTMLYHGESLQNDMLANLYVILHQLHTTARFATALKSIRQAMDEVSMHNCC